MKQRNYYKLNEGEDVVGSSDVASVVFDRGGFILTNQRVINVARTPLGGASKVHSINLENLDSIQTASIKYFILLLFAFVSLLFLQNDDVPPGIALSGCAIFVIAFFMSRRKVIRLASGNSIMWLNITAMAHEQIQNMVFQIEQAKQRRLEGIQKTSNSAPTPVTQHRLKELQSLLDEGLIKEDEYERKRQQILEQM